MLLFDNSKVACMYSYVLLGCVINIFGYLMWHFISTSLGIIEGREVYERQ